MSQLGWTVSPPLITPAYYVFATDGATILAVSRGYNEPVLPAYVSTDGGMTWQVSSLPNLIWSNIARVNGTFFLVSEKGWWGAGAPATSYLYWSTDLLTWSSIQLPFAQAYNEAVVTGAAAMIADGLSSSYYLTTNGSAILVETFEARYYLPWALGIITVYVNSVDNTVRLATTSDGLSWTETVIAPAPSYSFQTNFYPLATGGVVVQILPPSTSNPIQSFYSADGVSITPLALPPWMSISRGTSADEGIAGQLTLFYASDVRSGAALNPLYSRGNNPPVPFPLPDGAGADWFSISLVGTTYVFSGYMTVTGDRFVMMSTDTGATWSAPVTIGNDANYGLDTTGAPSPPTGNWQSQYGTSNGPVIETNGVWLTVGNAFASGQPPRYAISSDNGLTWTTGVIPIGALLIQDVYNVNGVAIGYASETNWCIFRFGVVSGGDDMAMLV